MGLPTAYQPISFHPGISTPKLSFPRRTPIAATPDTSVLWHKIAPGEIFPLGNESVSLGVALLDNGSIVSPGLVGPQVQGQLNPDGNYQLVNGVRGNLFQDSWLKIDLGERSNPFVEALKAAGRQRAVRGSEIPRLRQLLTSRGLNGTGIKIGILDPQEKDKKTGQWQQTPHTKLVSAIVNDPVWGVAPLAQVEELGQPFDLGPEDLPADSYQAFINYLTGHYQKVLQSRTQQLNSIVAKRDPALRVLNATWGGTRSALYMAMIQELLQKKNENGYPKYPALRQAILGPALNGSYAQQMQAVVNAVDAAMDNSPLVRAAHAQYVEATRQAANAGIVIVSSTANEGNSDIHGLSYKAGSQMSNFADSPYVIGVAAANTRQQPGNRAAYALAPFSSRGDGYALNPTIAAPGQEMGISLPQGKMGHNLTVDGTSFSTPFTCGVIALMLQRNPYLTFDQIKAKLQATAVKSPYYGPADYGAGFLNAEAAVLS